MHHPRPAASVFALSLAVCVGMLVGFSWIGDGSAADPSARERPIGEESSHPPRAGNPRGAAVVLDDPYASLKSHTYKGQLHFHSSNGTDGGTASLPAMLSAYQSAGYDFVCYTPHDQTAGDPGGHTLLYIKGCEESTVGREETTGAQFSAHIGSVGCSAALAETDIQKVIDAVGSDGAIAAINHPNRATMPLTPDRIRPLARYTLLEVYNGNGSVALAEDMWDYVLGRGLPVWSFASDDAHADDSSSVNRAWVVVHADTLTEAAVKEALRTGNFYATRGPDVSVSTTGTTITVTTSDTSTITFKNGATLQSTPNTKTADYNVSGMEHYVRAVVTRDSDSRPAWAQPIFVALRPRVWSSVTLSASRTLVAYRQTAAFFGLLSCGTTRLAGHDDVTLWTRHLAGGVFSQVSTATFDAASDSYLASPTCSESSVFQMRHSADETYAAAISNDVAVQVRAYLSRPWTYPGTVRRDRAFYVYGYLKPLHSGSTRLDFYRLISYRQSGIVHRRWRYLGYRRAVNYPYNGYVRYRLTLSPHYGGYYRVRAYHADAGHYPSYSTMRTYYAR